MWVSEEQHGAFLVKAAVGIMDDTSACCQADLLKIFAAVDTHCTGIALYLESIKAL